MDARLVADFQSSVKRCLESPSFIDEFYERFTGTSDAIREKFINTDFVRQRQAMADSLYMMAIAVQGGPTNLARLDMPRLREKHQTIGIAPTMYDTWLECMVDTARTHDPQFSRSVEKAWRKCLSRGVDSMKTGAPFKA